MSGSSIVYPSALDPFNPLVDPGVAYVRISSAQANAVNIQGALETAKKIAEKSWADLAYANIVGELADRG